MPNKRTLLLFSIICAAMLVGPFIFGLHIMGSQKVGFPFRFYEWSSAPPPAFGSTFSWNALLLDLIIYYLMAVACVALWRFLRVGKAP
jgi:hypothetical protein